MILIIIFDNLIPLMNQSKRYCPFWNELYLFYYYYYYSIDHDDDNVDIGDDDNNSNHSNNPNPLRFVLKRKKKHQLCNTNVTTNSLQCLQYRIQRVATSSND